MVNKLINEYMKQKTNTHPCYSDNAYKFARMHVPVASKCNISCNYCVRKYDCSNENKPGVISEVLTPKQVLYKFREVKHCMKNLTVVGIAGPGDALANFKEVEETLKLIRKEDPNITFCLSTNGLMLPLYAKRLIELGVSHVTVTINAVDKKIGAKIYKEVNYLGNHYTGEDGAEILINNQISGLKYLTSKGIICKVNTLMMKGINDEHIIDIMKKIKQYGVYISNIMKLIPEKGSTFEKLPLITDSELNNKRKECGVYIKQMYHCNHCRADSIGILSQDRAIDFKDIKYNNNCENDLGNIKIKDIEDTGDNVKQHTRVKLAISTKTGLNVDEHFGHTNEFYIYSYYEGKIEFIERRRVDKCYTGVEECDEHDNKIDRILKIIDDCQAILTLRIGLEPMKKLQKKGIVVIQVCDSIEKAIIMAIDKLKITNKLNI